MYVTDELHLSGSGATILSENLLRSIDSGTPLSNLNDWLIADGVFRHSI